MVPPQGPRTARWAIIGEAPGYEEDRQGLPFVGPAGQLLRKTLEKVGLDPEEAWITNVIKERPPGNATPNTGDIRAAIPALADELGGLPGLQAILVVGNVPLNALTGTTGITKRRGLVRERRKEFEFFGSRDQDDGQRDIDELSVGVGGDGAGKGPLPVFATLHPAAVLRNQNYYNGWLADLSAFAQVVNPPDDDIEITYVSGPESYTEFTKAISGEGSLDIETTIGNVFTGGVKLISVAVAFDEETAWVFRPGPWLDRAVTLMHDVKWTMHNGLFDALMLWRLMDWRPWLEHDTMALQYLLNPDERKGLEILLSIHLGMPPYKTIDYDKIESEPWKHVYTMNGVDAVGTLRLFRPLADQVNEYPQLLRTYKWLLMPALRALTDVTYTGVPVDRERLKALTRRVKEEHAHVEDVLLSSVPEPDPSSYPKGWPKGLFNPRSSMQVAHVLFDQFGLPILQETPKGKPSTAAEVLDDLVLYTTDKSAEWLGHLRTHRKLQKRISGYLEAWPKFIDSKDRMHPRFKPLHVVTGRLSSEDPNIQQVPREDEYRGVFGGLEGFTWIKADLSQIELRLAAWVAEEANMLEALRSGADLHAQTAELIMGDVKYRQTGKAMNFSLLYGAYPKKLRLIAARDYGVIIAAEDAEEYHRRFFEGYPGLLRWHQDMEISIKATGRSESPLGRLRILPDAFSSDRALSSRAVREGINHPIQSFASDLMLMALVRVNEEMPGLVVATVHDELDLVVKDEDVPFVVERVQAIMEDTSWLERWGIDLDVPVIAEITTGRYWRGD